MRVLQALLLAGILVVLTVIAIDLHRLAGHLAPNGPLIEALIGPPDPPNETRAQRNERLAREADEFDKDIRARVDGATRPAHERETRSAKQKK